MPKNNEEIIDVYLKLVGEQYAKNICEDIDNNKDEMDKVEFPHELDNWFNNFYITRYRKKRNKMILNKSFKYISRIASVFVVITIILGIVTFSVDAFRIEFLNFFINEESNNLQIISKKMSQDDEILDSYEDLYVFSYIPEGFVLQDIQGIKGQWDMTYVLDEQKIDFQQYKGEIDISLDNERHNISYGQLSNGAEIIISTGEKYNSIVWENDVYTFMIGGNVDIKILQKMAESIIWK